MKIQFWGKTLKIWTQICSEIFMYYWTLLHVASLK